MRSLVSILLALTYFSCTAQNDFIPPDLEAKVTGGAKYAEDFRADGMAFVKVFASPMPHAKVKKIDLSNFHYLLLSIQFNITAYFYTTL